jgi:hypothetical protein
MLKAGHYTARRSLLELAAATKKHKVTYNPAAGLLLAAGPVVLCKARTGSPGSPSRWQQGIIIAGLRLLFVLSTQRLRTSAAY